MLGRIDVTDDGGEVTGYQYCHSDADIYADTKLPYQDSIPLSYEKKELQREIAVSVLHEDRELGDPGRYFEESVSTQ